MYRGTPPPPASIDRLHGREVEPVQGPPSVGLVLALEQESGSGTLRVSAQLASRRTRRLWTHLLPAVQERDGPAERERRQNDKDRDPRHVVGRMEVQLPLPARAQAGRVGRGRRRDDDLRVGDHALDRREVRLGPQRRADEQVLVGRAERGRKARQQGQRGVERAGAGAPRRSCSSCRGRTASRASAGSGTTSAAAGQLRSEARCRISPRARGKGTSPRGAHLARTSSCRWCQGW